MYDIDPFEVSPLKKYVNKVDKKVCPYCGKERPLDYFREYTFCWMCRSANPNKEEFFIVSSTTKKLSAIEQKEIDQRERRKQTRERRKQRLLSDPQDHLHGSYSGYGMGCRCERCLEAKKIRVQANKKKRHGKR